eukprot:768699-Hanusia_phi.AAC.1
MAPAGGELVARAVRDEGEEEGGGGSEDVPVAVSGDLCDQGQGREGGGGGGGGGKEEGVDGGSLQVMMCEKRKIKTVTRQDKTRQDSTRQDKTRQDKRDVSNDRSRLLVNLICNCLLYYSQFEPAAAAELNGKCERHQNEEDEDKEDEEVDKEEQVKPVEKEAKDLVKICRWENKDFEALKHNLERSHRQLHKLLTKFDAALKIPFRSMLKQVRGGEGGRIGRSREREEEERVREEEESEREQLRENAVAKFWTSEGGGQAEKKKEEEEGDKKGKRRRRRRRRSTRQDKAVQSSEDGRVVSSGGAGPAAFEQKDQQGAEGAAGLDEEEGA